MSVRLKHLFIAKTSDRSLYDIPDMEAPEHDIQTLTVTRTEADGWNIEPFDIWVMISRDAAHEQNQYWASATIEIPELTVREQRPITFNFKGSDLDSQSSADFSRVETQSKEGQEHDATMNVHFELQTAELDSIKTTHTVIVSFADDLINSL